MGSTLIFNATALTVTMETDRPSLRAADMKTKGLRRRGRGGGGGGAGAALTGTHARAIHQ